MPENLEAYTATPCSWPGCPNYATHVEDCQCGETHGYCPEHNVGGA